MAKREQADGRWGCLGAHLAMEKEEPTWMGGEYPSDQLLQQMAGTALCFVILGIEPRSRQPTTQS